MFISDGNQNLSLSMPVHGGQYFNPPPIGAVETYIIQNPIKRVLEYIIITKKKCEYMMFHNFRSIKCKREKDGIDER